MADPTEIIKTETYTPEHLHAGMLYNTGETMKATLTDGETIKRGMLLTLVSGKLKAVTAKTQTIYGIACEDVTADGDTEIAIFVKGDFNGKALLTGTVTDSSTIADYVAAARNVGIIIRNI